MIRKMPESKNAKRGYPYGLSIPQQNALDLLVTGKSDAETAEAIGVHRVTVTRWRLYSPEFRAALAGHRLAIWGHATDRLRTLVPKAIDALAESLEQGEDKATIAMAILKLAGPIPLTVSESTDPEEVLRRDTHRERMRLEASKGSSIDAFNGLPEYKLHIEEMRERLSFMSSPGEATAEE